MSQDNKDNLTKLVFGFFRERCSGVDEYKVFIIKDIKPQDVITLAQIVNNTMRRNARFAEIIEKACIEYQRTEKPKIDLSLMFNQSKFTS